MIWMWAVPAMSTAKDKMFRMVRSTSPLSRLHKSKLRMPIRKPHQRLQPTQYSTTTISSRIPWRRRRRIPSLVTCHAIPVRTKLYPTQCLDSESSDNRSFPPVCPTTTAEPVRLVPAIRHESVDAEPTGGKLFRDGVSSFTRSQYYARDKRDGGHRRE
jgi:hypothetical protein